jgi:hypothetical protein
MSITSKLAMLPNQMISLALGVGKDDLKRNAKETLALDLTWAIKTAKQELLDNEDEMMQKLLTSLNE